MNHRSNNSEQFISLQKVSLRLHDKIIFKDTNWEILKDQHWIIAGSNGSGKSSLMKALCGKIPVIKGQILYHFIKDEISKTKWETRKPAKDFIEYVSFDQQGELLQRHGTFYQSRWNSFASDSTLAVSEYLSEQWVNRINLYEVQKLRPNPIHFNRRQKKVIDLLSLEPLMDKRIVCLSNGEMRKILIARALLRNPRLIIFNNPFTGLDRKFRAKMKKILEQLTKTGICLMVVTDRNEQIPAGITHMLLIQNNCIIEQGPIRDVIKGKLALEVMGGSKKQSTVPEISKTKKIHETRKEDNPVLVEMRNVHIAYDNHEILRGINWRIKKGENWALMGPNGSGKSTLLSLIFGDNPQAYANEIYLFGKRRGSGETIWEIKKRIGFVSPELHAYYPKRFTCFETICSGFFDSMGLYRKCSERQKKWVYHWMDILGIRAYENKTFGFLSSGEQRTILIARALVKQPNLLMLDEPCQNLDAFNRERILKIIDKICLQKDMTLIYVTHVPEDIPKTTTHQLILENGKVREKGQYLSLQITNNK